MPLQKVLQMQFIEKWTFWWSYVYRVCKTRLGDHAYYANGAESAADSSRPLRPLNCGGGHFAADAISWQKFCTAWLPNSLDETV